MITACNLFLILLMGMGFFVHDAAHESPVYVGMFVALVILAWVSYSLDAKRTGKPVPLPPINCPRCLHCGNAYIHKYECPQYDPQAPRV